MLVAIGHRPYNTGLKGLNLENVGVEVDSRERIAIDDQVDTSVPNIKGIGDEGIAPAAGDDHMDYESIRPEVAWLGKTEQEWKRYKVGRFPFLASSRAKTNMDTEA